MVLEPLEPGPQAAALPGGQHPQAVRMLDARLAGGKTKDKAHQAFDRVKGPGHQGALVLQRQQEGLVFVQPVALPHRFLQALGLDHFLDAAQLAELQRVRFPSSHIDLQKTPNRKGSQNCK